MMTDYFMISWNFPRESPGRALRGWYPFSFQTKSKWWWFPPEPDKEEIFGMQW